MIFESKVYKIDDKGERIIRIPGVPFPQNMQEETNEQLEKMAELARFVEVKSQRIDFNNVILSVINTGKNCQ